MKNGLGTGTTLGRINTLESFTRTYDASGVATGTSIEIAVLPVPKERVHCSRFSDAGDSGAIVFSRDGRIVGLLTGGAGLADYMSISYITPYWLLEKDIKAKFPDCELYEDVPGPY